MRPLRFSVAPIAGHLVCPGAVFADPGGVDGNGCHYERSRAGGWQDTYHCHEPKPADPDMTAPARKSREHICHDAGSSNYSKLQHFVY